MPEQTKDDWTPTEEEKKELAELEKVLVDLGERGELDSASEAMVEELWQCVTAQDALRQRIRSARRSLGEKLHSWPELIRQLRLAARVSLQSVADAVHLEAVEVERIESGDTNPLRLSTDTIVSFMEVFSIPFSQLEASLGQSSRTSARVALGTPLARAEGKVASELESAVRSVEKYMTKEEASSPDAQSLEGFLEGIRATLVRWQREDLLR